MKNNSRNWDDDQSKSVANLSRMINKVLKVLKKWNNTIKKRNTMNISNSIKERNELRKTISKSVDKEDPYSPNFIKKETIAKMNDTKLSMSSGRIKKLPILVNDEPKQSSQSPFPKLNVKNNIQQQSVYSNHLDLLNRGKYRKAMSHQRSMYFNENLAKLINENAKKENEIEKNLEI